MTIHAFRALRIAMGSRGPVTRPMAGPRRRFLDHAGCLIAGS